MKKLALIAFTAVFASIATFAIIDENRAGFYESSTPFLGWDGLLNEMEQCGDIGVYIGSGSSIMYSVKHQASDNIQDLVISHTTEFTISDTLKECVKSGAVCSRKEFEELLNKENYYHNKYANNLLPAQIAKYKKLTRCRYNAISSNKLK